MNTEQSEQTIRHDQNGDISQAFRIVLYLMTWLFWFVFTVVPTFTGAHGTAFLDVTNSIVFMMIGLVFCTAQNNAIRQHHTPQMVIFAAAMTALSIWF